MAIMYPKQNLIIVGEDNDKTTEAIKALIEYLSDNAIDIPGVIGEKILAEKFKEQWLIMRE